MSACMWLMCLMVVLHVGTSLCVRPHSPMSVRVHVLISMLLLSMLLSLLPLTSALLLLLLPVLYILLFLRFLCLVLLLLLLLLLLLPRCIDDHSCIAVVLFGLVAVTV